MSSESDFRPGDGLRLYLPDASTSELLWTMALSPQISAWLFCRGLPSKEQFFCDQGSAGAVSEPLIAAADAESGELVGALRLYSGECSFFVKPELQGHGWGRRIVMAALRKAHHLDWYQLYVTIRRDNERASRLVESIGFCFRGPASSRDWALLRYSSRTDRH